ncbi:MAG: SirB2 family protein [Motiliproteus sp.]
MYLLLKYIHLIAVASSISLFTTRAIWMLMESELHQRQWIRKLSQSIDTILLLSAISLTFVIKQYPLQNDWLTVKVTALLVYILFGTIALNRGKNRLARRCALLIAFLSVAYIIWVARNHYPWPWLL